MSLENITTNASAATTAHLYELKTNGPIAGRGEIHTLKEWKRVYGHDLESQWAGKKLLHHVITDARFLPPLAITAKHNIKFETDTPSLNLLECAVAVKQFKEHTREAVATLIRSYDYEAHIGGHHVGIMDGGVRLAIITSNTSDFN